jgi:type I restriction-modification system DNA methylase subunit
MNLFNRKLLEKQVKETEHLFSSIEKHQRAELKTYLLSTLDRINNSSFGKEESEKPRFLTKFFEYLGYEHDTEYQLEKIAITGSSDAALKDSESEKIAVSVEWKGVDHKDLERKKTQKGEAPVTQLFRYMADQQTKIGIVSNFVEIRVYHWDFQKERFWSFKLEDLVVKPHLVDHLYYLLCKTNVLTQNPVISTLARNTTEEEKVVTKNFYTEFKAVRENLYHHLIEQNPEIDRLVVLEKTQKFLDRFTFALVAEDVTLLPRGENNMGIIRMTYNFGKGSRDRGDEKIWIQFKNLFQDIDEGRSDISPKIAEYNGGLFKKDDILDDLHIKDSVWEEIVNLEKYDFATELNVNILGHIFEQSISDIEALKAEIEANSPLEAWQPEVDGVDQIVEQEIEQKPKLSKRKKDGIYYTPEYITKYIVENTIGRYLDENPDKLETIKILDPSCGSGAFLNQAHNYLIDRYKWATPEDEAYDLMGTNQSVQDKIKALKSLYGVDLQPESVEISKLSLWLKTADREHKLENLDSQIKCGNSLIDDVEVAGDRAFDWGKEFDFGGFDIIVGNPPYVGIQDIPIEMRRVYEEKYTSATGRFDLFHLFIEKSIRLLKHGGYLSFIIPNKFLTNTQSQTLRKYMLDMGNIVSILSNEGMVFDEANVNSVVIVFQKTNMAKDCDVFAFQNDLVTKVSTVERVVFENDGENRFIISQTQNSDLKSKIEANTCKLSDIADVKDGIVAGKVKDMLFHTRKINDTCKPILFGKDIHRYSLNFANKFVDYRPEEMMKEEIIRAGEGVRIGLWLRTPEIFERPKILTRQTADRVIASFDESDYYFEHTLHSTHIFDTNYNPKFVLAILNSNLMKYYYQSIISQSGTLFPQIRIALLKQLPIPKATQAEQEKLASLVDKIMALKADLHTREQGIKSFLKDNYGLEIKKQLPETQDLMSKIGNISLSQKQELHKWYDGEKKVLLDLENQVSNVDIQIDSEVYRLYGLNEEEILVIEKGRVL